MKRVTWDRCAITMLADPPDQLRVVMVGPAGFEPTTKPL
jgi:hypothetical protein